MTGPMTREAFIWAELSEMAPGRSSLPTSPGGWPSRPARTWRCPTPTMSTMTTSRTCEGWGDSTTSATPREKTSCSSDRRIRKRLPVDLVGQQAAHHRQDQRRPELGEDDDADEGARVREVVGVGAEDDVLHPGADVRREGAEEDDAEGPVRQGGAGRAPPGGERRVAVDDARPRSPRWRWRRRLVPLVSGRPAHAHRRGAGLVSAACSGPRREQRLARDARGCCEACVSGSGRAFSTPPGGACATVRAAPALSRGGPSSAKSGRNPALSRNGEAPCKGASPAA